MSRIICVLIYSSYLTVGTGIVYAQKTLEKHDIVNCKSEILEGSREVGEKYQGGIIFYVDSSGKHGLIASLADQIDYVRWSNNKNYILTGATDDGIGAGAANTKKIIDSQGPGKYAAQVAANFNVQSDGTTPCSGASGEICYNDWYLPSKLELNLLYLHRNIVGGFPNGELVSDEYWSSTEINETYVWTHLFLTGHQFYDMPKSAPFRVRAIRAF